jgi:hypothetical protein
MVIEQFKYIQFVLLGLFLFLPTACIKTSGSLNQETEVNALYDGLLFKSQGYRAFVDQKIRIPESDLIGSTPYKFTIEQGAGSIDPDTGEYQAPLTLGFAIISVKDSIGRLGYVSIEVVDHFKVKPLDFRLVSGSSYLIQTQGGKFPYSFSVKSGDVEVNSLGVVKAGLQIGPATILVRDSADNEVTVNVQVVSLVSILPTEISAITNEMTSLAISGGVGISQLQLSRGVGSVTNNPMSYLSGNATGTAVITAADEMANLGYGYARVFGSLQINPSKLKVPQGESYSNFEALGGIPPFTYSLEGGGSVNPNTGQYLASNQLGVERVRVTDAAGHTSEAVIEVTTTTRFFAKNAIVQSGENLDYSNNMIFGGTPPYQLALNASQGTYAGLTYFPPQLAGIYGLTVKDAAGLETESVVLVYPSFQLYPAQMHIAAETMDFFSVVGGVPPYRFEKLSGLGSINETTGAFQAGNAIGAAVVRATDSQNHTTEATVQIMPKLELTASQLTIEGGSRVTLTAQGGITPYTFSLIHGEGNLINGDTNTAQLQTGLNNTVVQVELRDAVGNRTSQYVQVISILSILPPSLAMKIGQKYFFGGQGGLGPYSFKLVVGSGSLAASGFYQAPFSPSTEKVRIVDSRGNTAESLVVVFDNLMVKPQSHGLLVGETKQLEVSGGVPPYLFSIKSGDGTVTASGLFVAPGNPGTSIVNIEDQEKNYVDAVFITNPPLEIIPNATNLKANKTFSFAATGGIAPYKFSVLNANGGIINSATGEYTAPSSSGNFQIEVSDAAEHTVMATVSVSQSGNNQNPQSGPADHIIVVAGTQQSGVVNTLLPQSLQIKVLDSTGAAVGNFQLKASITSGTGVLGFTSLTTGNDGITSTPFFLGLTAGTHIIRIEAQGSALPGTPSFVDFDVVAIPAAPSSFTSQLIATPNSTIPANGVSTATLTLTARDIYGNLVTGASIALNVSGTANTLQPSSGFTNASGVFTATLSSSVAESKLITVLAPTTLTGLAASAGFGSSIVPDPGQSSINGTSLVAADGVTASTITILLKSASGVGASGYIPAFSATDTGSTNIYGSCSMSDAIGESTCTLKSFNAEAKQLVLLTPVNKNGGTVQFIGGSPAKIAFTQQPVSAPINTSLVTAPVIEIRDAANNRVTTGSGANAMVTLTLISGSGTLTGTVSMNAVAGVADFSSQSLAFTHNGSKVIRVNSGGFSVDSNSFIIISPPTKIKWGGLASIARGTCSTISLSFEDLNNDATPADVDRNINVDDGGAGGLFYSDNTCTLPVSATLIAQGAATKTLYYRNNSNGNVSLAATAAGLTSGSFPVIVTVPGPTKLTITGPNSVSTQVCSAVFTITSKDDTNQAAPVLSSTTVSLTGQGSGSFYSDSSCLSSITNTTISAGSSNVPFYFKDATIENLSFTAAATGLSQGTYSFASQAPPIGTPDHLVYIGGNNQSGVVMTVLPASLQVKVVDDQGNGIPNVTLKATVTVGNGNPGYSTFTTDANGIALTPYFLGSTVGTETIRIEANATAFPGTPAFLDFNASILPGSPALAHSTLVASPNSGIPADGITAATLTVTVKDLYGNRVPNANVTLISSGTNNNFSQNATQTDSNGELTATLKTTNPENKTVSFSTPAALATLNTVIGFGTTIIPDASKSSIAGTTNIIADGVATAVVTITLKSAADVPAPGYVPNFIATDTGSTNTYGTCSLSDNSGVSTCTLASTKTENKILSIVSPFAKVGASVAFVNGPTDKILFAQQPVSSSINVALSPQPIIEIHDVFGNRVTTGPDATGAVTLSLISGNGALLGTTTMGAVAGVADFTGKNIAFNRSGLKTVKATMSTFNVTANPVSIVSVPSVLTWSGNTSITRGECGQLTLSSYDASGDLANVTTDLNITLGSVGSGSFYSEAACTNPIVGVTLAQGANNKSLYYKNNNTGVYNVSADASGFAQSTYAVTVIPGAPTKLVWSGPNFIGAGICTSLLTITTQDASSQPTTVNSATVITLGGQGSGSFYSNASCTTQITGLTIDADNSFANLYFKDGIGESLNLTATVPGLTQGSFAFESRYSVLYLSGTGGSTLDGVPITSCNGGSACNSTYPYLINTEASFYTITMVDGAHISANTWTSGAAAAGNGKLILHVTNDLIICTTCGINMKGKGYSSGDPGYGNQYGGSHGGKGGVQVNTSGAVYDSVMNPSDLGGGANSGAGRGGGLIHLEVGGSLNLNGLLQADGTITASDRGGAGGTIFISTNVLTGASGTLRTNGQTSNAGGGGGRIALYYQSQTYTGGIDGITKESYGGLGNWGPYANGAAGTIFYKQVGVDSVGHLIIKNNVSFTVGNYYVPTTELLADALSTNFNSFTVASNSVVEARSGTLNLPTIGTLNFPLYLNGANLGNVPGNNLQISSTGIFYSPGTNIENFNNLTIDGKVYQWNSNAANLTYKLTLNIVNNLTLSATGLIDVTGRGYLNGGPGFGLQYGGSHGGKGGAQISIGDPTYDSVTNPADLGGGASGGSGQGGGLVEITVGGNFTLNGSIQTNGTITASDRGGAGGSIKITTGTLSGSTGNVKANGQTSNAGGGGGRIALYYNQDSYTGGISMLSKEAFGATGNWGSYATGAAGTIFYKNVGVDSVGHLIIKNNAGFTVGNYYVPTTELNTEIVSTNWDSLTITANSVVELKSGIFNLPTTGILDFPIFLNGGSLGNVPNNDLTISGNGILYLAGGGPVNFNNLNVSGKIFQWNSNSNSLIYRLALIINQDLTLNSTGLIDVTGRGYLNGGPGFGLQYGGSHGGKGGVQVSVGDATYDSVINPADLGGGASSGGGQGGGLIELSVGGNFTLNGTVQANGTITSSDRGGAGGSVKITMGTLSGSTGTVKANGQTSNAGGGGGRVAIYYNQDAYSGGIATLTKEAYGAIGNWGNYAYGAAGTIFYKHVGVDTVGHLIIKNNPSFIVGNYYVPTTPLSNEMRTTNWDSITIADNSTVELTAGTFNLPSTGILNFPLFLNGGILGNMPNNDLNISTAGILHLPGGGPVNFNNLNVSGKIFQWNSNSNSLIYRLALIINQDLTLNSTGLIDVTGRGYLNGGPGFGLQYGGSHGGKGGVQVSVGDATYDSVINPADLGGGASSGGGQGGGLIELSVGGNFTLNGTVQANGTITSSDRGGAGGSVKITMGTLSGSTGTVKANGQTSNAGGGGGRVAIYYNQDAYSGGIATLTKEAYGAIGNWGNYAYGAAGTIFYKHVGVDTVGHLIIKNNPSFIVGNYYVPTTQLTTEMRTTNWDSITIASNSPIEVRNGVYNLPIAGMIDFPIVLNGGSLGNIPNNDLTITSTGILWLPGTGLEYFNNLNIDGKLFQWNSNNSVLNYKLSLETAGNLNLSATGLIDVSNQGYLSGDPAYGKNYGGSHGGKGGSTLASNWMYDSVTNPADLGGAGYSGSGQGGGLVEILTYGTFTLNGTIQANGTITGSDRGGAGGSIKIQTNVLDGSSGVLNAKGQGSNHGGGGGRIAVYYNTNNFFGGLKNIVRSVVGGGGYTGTANGGEGTVYFGSKLNLNMTTGSLPTNVNFSRASSASYYNSSGNLTFAASNQPRFDYNPMDLSSLGLLIEPSRTNLFIYSENFNQAYWTKQDLSLSAGALAPDGVTASTKIAETTATSFHSIGLSPSLSSGQNYVLSFYAKALERSWLAVETVNLAGTSKVSYVNLSIGTTGTSTHSKVRVRPINNGWHQVFIQFTSDSGGTTPTLAIGTALGDNSMSFAGTTGSGYYLWGLQLEQGNFGTSYMATNGTTFTRAADVATVTDLSWLIGGSDSRGSFILDAQVPFVDYNMPFIQLDNGSTSSSHRLGIDSGSYSSRYQMQESAVSELNLTSGTWNDGDRKKICAFFKVGSGGLAENGNTTVKGTPANVAYTGISTLRLGADHATTSFSGHLLKVQYMQEAFNDETCKQLSQ